MAITEEPLKWKVLERHNEYVIIGNRMHFLAIPENLPFEGKTTEELRHNPFVLEGSNFDEIRRRIPSSGARAIEFAGWLPAFESFGNCGTHPQFGHIESPPEGYYFIQSEPPSLKQKRPNVGAWLGRLVMKVITLLWLTVRPFFAILRSCLLYSPWRSARTLLSVIGLYFRLRRAGARPLPIIKFIRNRQFTSQVLLPSSPNLLFLTSVPYTFGNYPWVIEIEDATTLFYPHIGNGGTAALELKESPYFPIVKTLLEADNCRGIITHMRSTAQALPKMFASDIIERKTTYVSCGTEIPTTYQRHDESKHINLLFTCSWHQDPDSFFLRGGLDVLRAFEIVQARYPQARLTLRTSLPRLRKRYRRILERCWVRVIDRFLSDSEMHDLMCDTHVFLLPAARIHVVSILRAMAYGQVVVTSDGWGFDEYVKHGHNGLIVPGRYGKQSWEDDETGMLREDYRRTKYSDSQVVRGLVESISQLVEDASLRRRLGANARANVAANHTLAQWNAGLKKALDLATGQSIPEQGNGRIETKEVALAHVQA